MNTFNASLSRVEHSESADQNKNIRLPSDALEVHGSRKLEIDDIGLKAREEEMRRVSRVESISKGVAYYRHRGGLLTIVPWFVHLVAHPGPESCIDDSHVFQTLFEDPLLDPVKVAEKIWADHRPLVLSRQACGQPQTVEGKENTNIFIPTGVFRFLDLPGELRNKIYVHMLRSSISLKDLTGKTSDWFNPAILCTNRQIHSESSSVTYNQQIAVLVDPMAVACYQKGLHRLPEKSQFKRCWVDIDMSDPRLVQGHIGNCCLENPIARGDFRQLVEDMKSMEFLEELRVSCKWFTCLEKEPTSCRSQTILKNSMHVFRKSKGLRKLVIEGDFR